MLPACCACSFCLRWSCPAAKKTTATARGENEDLVLTVTLHIDPAEIKEWIGNDLDGHYIVAEVKSRAQVRQGHPIDRDDFVLRTDKDGEKAQPFAASQIAGGGGTGDRHGEQPVTVSDRPAGSGRHHRRDSGRSAWAASGKGPDNGGGQRQGDPRNRAAGRTRRIP